MQTSWAMPFEKNHAGFAQFSSALSVMGAYLILLPLCSSAQNTEARLDQARVYFEKAQQARQALEETPDEEQTHKQYASVVEAYRVVYYTAPSYGNNTICLMAIGELYQEMARRWEQPKDIQSAVQAYEFLVREYPHSRYRQEALFTIARIYREELRQPEEAVRQLERYIKAYPRSPQAEEARQAITAIQQEMAMATRAEEAVQAATPPPPQGSLPETPPSGSKGLVQVTDVRYWGNPTYTRVVIDLEKEVKYELGQLGNPPRVYIDLYNARIGTGLSKKALPVESGLLKNVRVGQFQPDVSRIVLDLSAHTEFSLFELPNPQRLVIDIRDQSPEAVKTEATPMRSQDSQVSSARLSPSPTAEVVQEISPPVVEIAKPAQPTRDGAHSLTRALGLKIGRIMLDPGHGGHDTGAIGPTGLYEKEVVLDIAKRLGKLLEERFGSDVLYTRHGDTFIPLESRTALANELRADLFVSIHLNSSRSPQAQGIETYYLNFTTDPEALEVAARENAVSQETISQLQGLVQKIALAEKVDESREFATHVQTALGENLADGNGRKPDRGVKKAPFVVLIGANMPSILAEISFLSNPQEEKRLRTPDHRQKVAEALFAGIVGYAETLSGIKVARSE